MADRQGYRIKVVLSKIVLDSRLELDTEGLSINEEFNISAEPQKKMIQGNNVRRATLLSF